MRVFYFVLFSLISINESYAQNNQIFSCRSKNTKGSMHLTLDSVGQGILSFKDLNAGIDYTCKSKISFFSDGSKSVAPNWRIIFGNMDCGRQSEALANIIYQETTLIIFVKNKNVQEALVQWIQSEQPDYCRIEKFSEFDFHLNYKKWLEGVWGR